MQRSIIHKNAPSVRNLIVVLSEKFGIHAGVLIVLQKTFSVDSYSIENYNLTMAQGIKMIKLAFVCAVCTCKRNKKYIS